MSITREEILKSPDYWVADMQVALYNCAAKFMSENGMNRTQLAQHLGVSKGYVSQLLNGDYDHKLSKFVELSLKFGFVPKVEFERIEDCIKEDSDSRIHSWVAREYLSETIKREVTVEISASYVQAADDDYGKAA